MTSHNTTFRGFVAAWVGCCIAAAWAYAAEPRMEAPTFPAPTQSFKATVQTGTGRSAKATAAGLYRVPAGAGAPYCAGRRLPLLFDGVVFVRGVDDFYTRETAVWLGDLAVQGKPGMIPPPVPQGFTSAAKQAFRGVFRTEQDGEFQHNALKECAPNWYFPKAFDIIGVKNDANGGAHANAVKVSVWVVAPVPGGQTTLRIALNSNAIVNKDNALTVKLNGALLFENFGWKGPGYRIIEADFSPALLKDGANEVELLGDPSYVKYLDWVEIITDAQPRLRNGSLIVQAKESGSLALPEAKYAVDITNFGAEHAMEGKDGLFALAANHLYYFADRVAALDFGPETALAEPCLDGKNYVCVGLREMLPALEPLLQRKTAEGLAPACVAFEDVMNVYNDGMYGPDGLVAMIARAKPAYVLLACGFNRDCRDRLNHRAKNSRWNPGIPAHLRQTEQLTVTDDPYTLDFTVKVGRVPVAAKDELAMWVAKAARYKPSDTLVLLAGKNTKADFSAFQRQYLGKEPSSLVEAEGRPPEQVRRELFGLLDRGARLVAYQGHAQSWEIDKGLLNKSYSASMPESCWLLATCNGAYYHADYDVYVRDWMTAPTGGCVNAIASASVGEDDEQDQVVRRFVEDLAKRPEDDWGGMMQYLKKNLPLAEETMKDPNTPVFLRKSIAKDRKTIDAYSLLGDPALRVFASPARKVAIDQPQVKPGRPVLPPGPAALLVEFSGPWDAASFAADHFAVQGRASGKKTWEPLPLKTPLAAGRNALSFDSSALGSDGGIFELRVIENHSGLPETVWTMARILQEGLTPPAPVLHIRKSRASAQPELECIARARGPIVDPKSVETQFQVRDKARPDKMLQDTGWQAAPRYSRPVGDPSASLEIRARCRKNGVEGPWSDWTPLAPQEKKEGERGKR